MRVLSIFKRELRPSEQHPIHEINSMYCTNTSNNEMMEGIDVHVHINKCRRRRRSCYCWLANVSVRERFHVHTHLHTFE